MNALLAWAKKHPQRTAGLIQVATGSVLTSLPTLGLSVRTLALAIAAFGLVQAIFGFLQSAKDDAADDGAQSGT